MEKSTTAPAANVLPSVTPSLTVTVLTYVPFAVVSNSITAPLDALARSFAGTPPSVVLNDLVSIVGLPCVKSNSMIPFNKLASANVICAMVIL